MGEEITTKRHAIIEAVLNATTHGLGLLIAVVLSPFLISAAPAGLGRVSVIVYCVTMIALFSASTLYHAFEESRFAARWSSRLQVLDHMAIYLFIAGSYTPFLIITLDGFAYQWAALVCVWAIAIGGVIFKLFFGATLDRWSVGSYLVLGWISVLVAPAMLERLSTPAILGLVAGGLFYTAGVWFFVRDHRRFHHAIWHLFVFAGAAAHLLSVASVLRPVL